MVERTSIYRSAVKKSEDYTAALFGKTGVGKTTIYNSLCNTTHAASYSESSLTFEIRKNDVSYGD